LRRRRTSTAVYWIWPFVAQSNVNGIPLFYWRSRIFSNFHNLLFLYLSDQWHGSNQIHRNRSIAINFALSSVIGYMNRFHVTLSSRMLDSRYHQCIDSSISELHFSVDLYLPLLSLISENYAKICWITHNSQEFHQNLCRVLISFRSDPKSSLQFSSSLRIL